MLTRKQAIPYELELRYTIDACLHRLDQLEAAAIECLDLAKQMRSTHPEPEVFADKTRTQARIFDDLDALLSAYARVSLLIFPVGSDPFTKDRAATMQQCLKLNTKSKLNDRDLRDAWMHHDERMDKNVSANKHSGGQLFKLSAEVTLANKTGFLRVIEIDTLVVHYHDRHGTSKSAILRDIRVDLEDLERTRKNAFDALR